MDVGGNGDEDAGDQAPKRGDVEDAPLEDIELGIYLTFIFLIFYTHKKRKQASPKLRCYSTYHYSQLCIKSQKSYL